MKEKNVIKYHKGFKYQLKETEVFHVACKPESEVICDFLTLTPEGVLTIDAGYAWDGPSGPTFDTRNFMRGSLVHDALYQLMRQECLPLSEKENADDELIKYCLRDGMSKLRSWWVYKGLDRFGTRATLPENKRQTLTAPI